MVVCLPGWAYMMSYKLAYASVISCWVGWKLGGPAKPGLRWTASIPFGPSVYQQISEDLFAWKWQSSKTKWKFARPVELSFATREPYVYHIVLVQTDHEASRNWSFGEIDFFIEGLASHGAKSMNSGKKSSETIFAINMPHILFPSL